MYGYLLTLAFDGTDYCGWQVQPNCPSVQETLQDACEKVFGTRPPVTGCSRTDSGVHAKGFAALVTGDFSVPCESLPLALNSKLPPDISVLEAREAPEGFHPRYDALKKEYVYKIHNSRIRDPFLRRVCWEYPAELDAELMNTEAQDFVGKQDFCAFMASGSKITDTVRRVYDFSVTRQGDEILFRVSADGFLYNMVRIMVGTLTDISRGGLKLPLKEIIRSGDRANAGVTAPAKGLCLNRVFYGED